jgi:hypothetical protein
MFQRFFGAARFSGGAWPQGKIVDVLKRRYQKLERLGDQQGFTLFGISDNGVNFVVALLAGPAAGSVSELAFLARFVGFPVDAAAIDRINSKLHLSVMSREGEGDLYLLAGVEASGAFDEKTFGLLLDAWRRDLMLVLHALSGSSASLADAFPVARAEAARSFAINMAPDGAHDRSGELLKAFVGGEGPKAVCKDCYGRGRRGLIAKECDCCGGAGFVRAR